MSSYISYKQGTRIVIKSTGEQGEAFESVLGHISIFIDGEKKCKYFKLEDVEFIKDGKNK